MQKEQWNHKKWVRLIISKIGPPRYPKTHPGPKRHPKGPRRAKIGINASHAVQLTSLRQKKTDLNPTPQRSAPLTWNQPGVSVGVLWCRRLLPIFWLCEFVFEG